MRQALEKLSAGSPAVRSGGSSSPGYGLGKPARHRYVQDGEVVVEHAAGSRARGPGISVMPATGPEPRFTELQAALATERAAREQAERAQERAQQAVRALETRLKHTEVAFREAVGEAEARTAEAAALRAELANLAAQRAAEQAPALAEEAEPVKWWIRSKPVAVRASRERKRAVAPPKE